MAVTPFPTLVCFEPAKPAWRRTVKQEASGSLQLLVLVDLAGSGSLAVIEAANAFCDPPFLPRVLQGNIEATVAGGPERSVPAAMIRFRQRARNVRGTQREERLRDWFKEELWSAMLHAYALFAVA